MRMSKLFGQTLREAPADVEVESHRLLLRAGFIRQLGAGIFTLLPLAQRSIDKIENVMRDEINAIGGQEITMPVVNPADIWKETNRWFEIGSELGRFLDKNGRDMVLALSHEEVVADLVRREIHSYRQLPRLIYHIQTKWRDDPRPRAGLIRVREFTMKDSYSLDADEEGLDAQYRAHYQAYFNIFNRCGLPVIAVGADVGMMGGSMAHEFMYLTPIGEDTLLISDECGYRANRQIAEFQKPVPDDEALLPAEKVATPDVKTIADLAAFLEIPTTRTAKAVFLIATHADGTEEREQFVFVVVRGDMDVNETKLASAVKAKSLRPATEAEIRSVGAVPGYASPVGLNDVVVVVDDLIPQAPNLVAGANEEGFHTRNINYGRDFEADIVADIVSGAAGDLCLTCGKPLREARGVEVGNIFKLGTHYSVPMGATFLDRDGQQRPVVMGSYGIGSGRLLASIAEEHRDENGLIWPITISPYHVHIVALRGAAEAASTVYHELEARGIEVLFDDREESPGVMFNDADLIGIPIRLTVSERSLKQDGVELKLRAGSEKEIVPMAELNERIAHEIARLVAEIEHRVVEVPFEAV